jgi:putative ABC transport system permease protein
MKRVFHIGRFHDSVTDDVRRELDQHLESRALEFERQGLSPAEARQAALASFGDRSRIEAELVALRRSTVRARNRHAWWSELVQDVRVALRGLRRTPGFTAVALLTLAIGIGANSAVFSVVRSVLLRPLPYPDAGRLVQLWTDYRQNNGREEPEWLTPPDFLDWRDHNRTFAGMAAYAGWGPDLTGSGDPVSLTGLTVTGDYFTVLGVPPALGRVLLPADDDAGAERTVVLSDGIWRSRFGSDPGILGRQLQLNGEPWTVVGVMPPHFRPPVGGAPPDIIRALRRAPDSGCGRGCIVLRAIGRLQPGITMQQAHADLAALSARAADLYPETNRGVTAWLIPLKDQITGPTRHQLLALTGAIAFVLLIACVNLASLLLVRGAGRTRELAVRAALGAGRGRLVRQLLVESAVLALLGGLLGLGLGIIGARVLATIVPSSIRAIQDIRVDGPVIGFTALIAGVSGLLFGILPALQSAGRDLMGSIRGGGQRGGRRMQRTLDALVVAEVTLAVTLLVGAGLLLSSFLRMQEVDLGYRARGATLIGVTLPRARYSENARVVAAFDDLLSRLRAHPVITGAELTDVPPLQQGDQDVTAVAVGEPLPPGGPRGIWYRSVSPGYRDLMQFRRLAGRDFTPEDREGAPAVAMVNQEAARLLWAGKDPLGRVLQLGSDSSAPRVTIVGVVASARHDGPNQPYKPELLLPIAQVPSRGVVVVLEAARDPAAAVLAFRTALREVDPLVPMAGITAMEDLVSAAVASPRLNAVLIGAFAGVALLLAMLGVYGVMAYVVSQRRREIGVRLALGAAPAGIRQLVLEQGARLAAVGMVLGLGTALAMGRFLRSLLFEVSLFDPGTLVAVPLLLAAMALLACWIPARRAVRLDPVEAIRAE